jgi:hypothetical protein
MFAGLYCASDPIGMFHGEVDENGHSHLSRVEAAAGNVE